MDGRMLSMLGCVGAMDDVVVPSLCSCTPLCAGGDSPWGPLLALTMLGVRGSTAVSQCCDMGDMRKCRLSESSSSVNLQGRGGAFYCFSFFFFFRPVTPYLCLKPLSLPCSD